MLILLFTCLQHTLAQPGLSPTPALEKPVDLATNGVSDDISASTWLCFSHLKTISPQQLPNLDYPIKGTKKYEHFITPERVNYKAVLRFTLTNSSAREQSSFFCPGFYYDSIRLFRQAPHTVTVTALPDIFPDDPDSLGYRKITLAPHDTAVYYALLTFIRSPTNSINPSLTREDLITHGILYNHKNKTSIDIMTNLFAGIMLMMIFYGVSEYLQTAKPEFLYYAGYCFFISTLLFLKSILHNATTSFNFFFEGFLDNIIFCLGHISYIVFHRMFLETRKNYKSLDRYLFWGAAAIGLLMILYIVTWFLIPDFTVANSIEDYTKYVLMTVSLVFIVKGLSYRNQLMNYIVMGNISLFALSILSQVIIATNFHLVKSVSVLNLALFYYEVGITIELLFFLFALTYKNKMEIILSIQKEEKLKLETERKELEKQVAVLAAKQDERNRISADMHDELGSGVTAIRLMSEIVKSKMKDQVLPEIEKISHSANELLNKMNTIIWTMTSSNDSVENLVAYIRSYAVEFFENTSIDCYFSMPASIPHREINGEKRRNMFLSVKEALNNVLKHSQSSVVKINVTVSDKLIIQIQDDGVGINMEKLRKFGNGLHNMKKRMTSIDGEFEIANHQGTRTTFGLTL
ncbi:sensor histidine kinase [Flavitalea sp. BT771]|uniref:sensor histidine kinase n=1 Tax=Flavitalea sp. BT771 TaxID=3063329 RepID=UPI0026E21C6F|nr:sensor histidine kinase [Flavitalea sp. BT771]MDO6429887.1 sensor histidine kinase [Flavitalea sp. BT771]MDV6217985.1 sensor histidine kinase [Flavitalea sp. BT771]